MSALRAPLRRTLAVGVVVPVHNEEELLGAALASLNDSFAELRDLGLDLKAAVVLDDCHDASTDVVAHWSDRHGQKRSSITCLVKTCTANNVGVARGLGCSALLEVWNHLDPSRIWLATTDGDSRVPREWLSAQIEHHESGVDLWSGRVAVEDWSFHSSETVSRWQREYEEEVMPIHGANLGFNAGAYLASGGFVSTRTGEDRALHRALSDWGAVRHTDSTVRVVTSSRRSARAPLGFAHALNIIGMTSSARTSDAG